MLLIKELSELVHIQMYSQYQGFNRADDIMIWFWKLVKSLKEEEKALLLKFATGSPRTPAGGFASLQVAALFLFYHAVILYVGRFAPEEVGHDFCGMRINFVSFESA